MKKLFSISIALLMLLSGMQLTISRHYCGGELADSKVSAFGKVASCGMESGTDECTQPGSHLESRCCDNKVSVYAVDHNFSPSFTDFKASSQTVLHVFVIPENITFNSLTQYSHLYSDVSPPGFLVVNSVSLPKICVFRIWFFFVLTVSEESLIMFHFWILFSCVLILVSWYLILSFNTLTSNTKYHENC